MKPSIYFEDRVELGLAASRAWELLKDPNVVVTCLPGAEIVSIGDDGVIEGALSLSLGPSTTRFAGRVTPVYDDETRAVEISGQGADGKGRTRASITTSVRVEELDNTSSRLAIDSSIAVSGALAAFAASGGQAIAKRMMLDFSENLGRLGASVAEAVAAAERDGAAADDVDVAAAAAVAAATTTRRRLGGFGLLLRTVRDAVAAAFARLCRRQARDETARHDTNREHR